MKKSLEWLASASNKLNVEDTKRFHKSMIKSVDSETLARQKRLFRKAKAVTS